MTGEAVLEFGPSEALAGVEVAISVAVMVTGSEICPGGGDVSERVSAIHLQCGLAYLALLAVLCRVGGVLGKPVCWLEIKFLSSEN